MRQTEEQLAPFYEYAVRYSAVGIHAVDLKGHTVLYNAKMKQIEGLELPEMTDRSLLELFRFGRGESTLLRVIQSKEPILNVKQTYWNKKGQEITTINDTYPVFKDRQLVGAIELARDVTELERAVYQPLKKGEDPVTFEVITAVSCSMKKVVETARKASIAKLPVLLTGESGTGKELIAEAIHEASSPEGVFHSFLCHSADKKLITQLSEQWSVLEGGTVFFERLDLLPIEEQKLLLDVLLNRSNESVYFLASIGEDPIELIASSRLLKDLYYFFSSMAITLEPLRKRKEDILPFAENYLTRHNLKFGTTLNSLSDEVHEFFCLYDWPGNLKELELLLDEVTSVHPYGETVTLDMLPQHFLIKTQRADHKKPEDFVVLSGEELIPLEAYLQEAEVYYVQKALDFYNGNVTKAAQALGMSRQNLQYRIRKMKKQEGEA